MQIRAKQVVFCLYCKHSAGESHTDDTEITDLIALRNLGIKFFRTRIKLIFRIVKWTVLREEVMDTQ